MAIRVALNHTTVYRYDRLVELQPHVVRLRPAPHCRTPILSYSLRIEPRTHFLNWQQDPYSNFLARLVFPEPSRLFSVEVDLVAEMTAINPFDFFIQADAQRYPFPYDPVLAGELLPYLETQPAGPRLRAIVQSLRRADVTTIDYLVDLNRHLHQAVRYLIRLEPGVQTCEETLTQGSGSCRDSAWLLVQVLRHLGLAARFASGYLIQLAVDQKALDGPSGPDHDFTDLHAWAEVYLPGAGWIGLDPTSGLLAGEGHIPLACAANPTNAAPVTGSFTWLHTPGNAQTAGPVAEDLQFHMSLTRIHETPRVTRPYTDAQWQAIDALGQRIDKELKQGDVRLTMGGEPTFVSIDDRDAPEWNTDALGTAKRQQAGQLLRRLRDRFAPGGLLHFGQGKWYPGESLPRWAFGCFWRRDGHPLWLDPALFADESRDYGHDASTALRFTHTLAQRLGLDPSTALPAYEDVYYHLWRERRLPVNVDPFHSRLDNAEERATLARVFEGGLGTVLGYALPLKRRHDDGPPHWTGGHWLLRGERLYLVPGDSPIGFRLPLQSLTWAPVEEREPFIERDPFTDSGPLPPRPAVYATVSSGSNGAPPAYPLVKGQLGHDIPRTALCVEPRGGRLYVFLPPQEEAEDFLDLVAAVEVTAAELALPVVLEGYPPPSDPRLNQFFLTPDPGVLEVNLHPSATWDELVTQTTVLYEEAWRTRLTAEKFMLDGRHTGTGGGNHVLLGGATPADSPVLRRPDLLRSLIGYWHNHPSLSYLFSGLFIGPTSQAPRVDEARNDSVYELELAFRQIPDRGKEVLPWLCDRVFRHLLADVTGNTHRSEFCIDKLYTPETSSGRRGLVELRAFEMPPHARMSLVQQLLLRALVARFWKEPYHGRPVRWGTDLHDRFMLPHFIEQDFADVLLETRQAGYALEDGWFAPHIEFRFPRIGAFSQRGVQVELRQAIEPWHVLAEVPGGGGAVRYVDSSLERIEVKVTGLIDSRHLLTCNGRRLPLTPTGTNGEFVAGVRFRAWQPPSCLHPTIPVHAPLVIDLLDTWMGRSLGGCTYHVAHPGGRAFETLPVNAGEAEARRLARFIPFGHTPGPCVIPPAERHPECPLTLDLRQPVAAGESVPVPPAEGTSRLDASIQGGRFDGVLATPPSR